MDGHDSEDPKQSTADMTVFAFLIVSCWFIDCILDEMGSRINELEQSINDLKSEMGVEGSPSPMTPSKSSADEVKKDEGSALK
ncbi:hypothetical protein SDJN02_24553 [Cucurbita argyrosperma subsp. argyrosperma]|nr:hypothetical protein SDJN02_24553 [Cucurbita argyrosperma subsp. argyrosperma]